jgi:hypothetical protein
MFVDSPAKSMNQNIWWSNSPFASDPFYVDVKRAAPRQPLHTDRTPR